MMPKLEGVSEVEEKRAWVTVILATLNSATTLQRCLDSIAAQTWREREVVIMDGGSTDGTVDILRSNQRLIRYWESQKDRGIYHAWNKALDHARGEWVCFLGADDALADARALEKLMAAATDSVDLVCALGVYVEDNGKLGRIWGEPWNWEQLKREQRFCHPASLHRRALFERYGRFDDTLRIAADYDFHLRLGRNARAAFLNEVVVRLGETGASQKRWRRTLAERMRVQARCPEIGWPRALWYAAVTAAKILVRRWIKKAAAL
jgi:glycosyltransferase involved in cell wall biosynthesis